METGTERTETMRGTGTKWLTTKFVFDWRFRERKWIQTSNDLLPGNLSPRNTEQTPSVRPPAPRLVTAHTRHWVATGTFPVLHRREGRFSSGTSKEQNRL